MKKSALVVVALVCVLALPVAAAADTVEKATGGASIASSAGSANINLTVFASDNEEPPSGRVRVSSTDAPACNFEFIPKAVQAYPGALLINGCEADGRPWTVRVLDGGSSGACLDEVWTIRYESDGPGDTAEPRSSCGAPSAAIPRCTNNPA